MPRFRISDLLWLTAVIAVAVVLIGFGQSVFGPSIEGSGCAGARRDCPADRHDADLQAGAATTTTVD